MPRRMTREQRQAFTADEHLARITGLIKTMREAVAAFDDAQRVVDDLELLPPQDIDRVLLHLEKIAEVCNKLDELQLVALVQRVRRGGTNLVAELRILRSNFYTHDLWTKLQKPEAMRALGEACDTSQRGYIAPLHNVLKAIGRVNANEDVRTFEQRVTRMRARQKSMPFVG